MRNRTMELAVGLFMLAGLLAFFILSFKVSGLANHVSHKAYVVTATFDNVGDLKVRAPVTIAGVKIGEVASVKLDKHTFKAQVGLRINQDQDQIPSDSTASIFTEGILGSNYISITPGVADEDKNASYLHDGAQIQDTQSALIIENLIGQFMFSIKGGDKK